MLRISMIIVSILALGACLADEGRQAEDDTNNAADTTTGATDTIAATTPPADTSSPSPDTATSAPESDTTSTSAPEPDTAVAPDTTEQCVDSGDDCRDDDECCSGICSYTGSYGVDFGCIEARQIREACNADHWCASGFCVNGLCAVGACLPVGEDCSWDELRCCYPSFCSWQGNYAPGYCTAPQDAGASCAHATWCKSGACSADGLCL